MIEGGTCYITIREELGRADRAAVLRREKTHCNGWPADHTVVGTRMASAGRLGAPPTGQAGAAAPSRSSSCWSVGSRW